MLREPWQALGSAPIFVTCHLFPCHPPHLRAFCCFPLFPCASLLPAQGFLCSVFPLTLPLVTLFSFSRTSAGTGGLVYPPYVLSMVAVAAAPGCTWHVPEKKHLYFCSWSYRGQALSCDASVLLHGAVRGCSDTRVRASALNGRLSQITPPSESLPGVIPGAVGTSVLSRDGC